ncbi:MAG: class I tRNA ligase family protein, partial [Candidatus Magasanikbacteria bacterium]|nr:class I tRNA ligase family protein [Candidatus Magasanikbacteria bacterium]
MPYNASHNEKDILAFWDKENIFERSVTERPKNEPYVFYDGPPFATGLPHYGHIVASVMKDVVPRYFTMQGKRVERVWGWDCHGLPIENIVEKELGTKSKKDIEELGVEKFNELCRSKVLSYVGEWQKTIHRLGRWVDMEHAYRTMDLGYMESVWWVFKQLWEKQLVYEGYRPMHICPRCETTLSQQEVSEGYKDIKDVSVTAQFKVTGNHPFSVEGDVYFLAWTTTPWTLPGNVLLAVGLKLTYVCVSSEEKNYILAKDLVEKNFEGKTYSVVSEYTGTDLVGLTYEPLFPYFANSQNSFRVVAADFVTTEDGTGIVHLAPAFGTDDYEVFKKENVPFIQHVGMDGKFIDAVTDFAGMHVKPSEDHTATDVEIVKWLAHNGKLFSKKKYEHSYPHCWRCDTPLLNYAT